MSYLEKEHYVAKYLIFLKNFFKEGPSAENYVGSNLRFVSPVQGVRNAAAFPRICTGAEKTTWVNMKLLGHGCLPAGDKALRQPTHESSRNTMCLFVQHKH